MIGGVGFAVDVLPDFDFDCLATGPEADSAAAEAPAIAPLTDLKILLGRWELKHVLFKVRIQAGISTSSYLQKAAVPATMVLLFSLQRIHVALVSFGFPSRHVS